MKWMTDLNGLEVQIDGVISLVEIVINANRLLAL